MDIQHAIRELRKAYGENQQYFATRLEIAMGSLAYYETGLRRPDLRAVLKFEYAADLIRRKDLRKIFANHVAADLGRNVIQADDDLQYEGLELVQKRLREGEEKFTPLYKKLMLLIAELEADAKPKKRKPKDTQQ
jgi:transcriptional regulator with XRE-family HTH domain